MNIFSVAHAITSSVNPKIAVTIKVNQGYVTNSDGSRSASYAAPVTAYAQMQALEYNDIVQADSLQIQGVRRKIYIYGEVDGLVRSKNKGGDLISTPDGSVWKVAMIAEAWPQWTCAIITLQDGA